MMYRKKRNIPLFIALFAVLLVTVLLAGLSVYKGKKETQKETELETEPAIWEALLYKPAGAVLTFEERYLKSDTEEEAILRIPEGTLVTLSLTPQEGERLERAEVVDYAFTDLECLVTDAENGYRINFVMPNRDILVNFYLAEAETQTEGQTEAETETELETELETETEAPYGLTLTGVTADFIVSFNGLFDDRAFLQALGDALHMDSARSEYQDVTEVAILGEAYEGEAQADQLCFYVLLNGEEDRQILCTYYLQEGTYLFTEVEPETETEALTETAALPEVAVETGTGGAAALSGNSQASLSGGNPGGTTVTTSLDLLSVSTTFLSYTGDSETFYQEAFDYVLDSGLSGEIIGTMTEYAIQPEEEIATFSLALNTGATITGTFQKAEKTYHFSGL